MKCPKCNFENPAKAKFCVECGNKFEVLCPVCGFGNLPTFKFCAECGEKLAQLPEPAPKALSFDDKLEQIQKYLPKGIAEKIFAQKGKIEGERKQVTVMFCDMVGFTALSDRFGAEDIYSLMDEIFEILIHKVHAYEGMVNKMTGDGIMALFGAPIALEDAPQRAIRSAFAIHREITRLSDKIKNQIKDIPPIKMRIGIHTGPVVVGAIGNNLRVEFTAVGNTVNLASRMEGLAEPGTTYVSEEAFKLTEGFFRFENQGQKSIKGMDQPVTVYRVISPSMRRTRFDVHAERGLTSFVGRKRELELLMDSFERAKEGTGQAVLVVAEAGLGKSRFLYEFRKAILNDDITFLEGRCFSYSRSVPYYPVADVLKSEFAIMNDEKSEAIKEKVITGLKRYQADEKLTLPFLLEILSVRNSGIEDVPLSPETKKSRIFEAIKLLVLRGSTIRPLVLAIEDLHWMDKSTEEIIKDLLNSISGHRVLLILTYRPEGVADLGGKSYINQINLLRLTNRETLCMAKSILGTDAIENSLQDLLLQRTEGVPFFIEEYLQSLKELKIITRENNRYRLSKGSHAITVPSTIQDVIMARVDALSEEARKVLRTGAVIEREFSYELIKHITGLPENDLLAILSILKDIELIYERGIFPDVTYVFKHALTREVLYNAILPQKKKALHAQIGIAIEQVYKRNIEEQYGLLVDHFMAGGLFEKGAEYAKLASKQAVRAISYKGATDYSQKCILCLERLPKTDMVLKQIIDTRTALAGYYLYLGQPPEAMTTVRPIVKLAENMNFEKKLPTIYAALGSYALWVEEDYPKGLATMQKAIKLSERLDDYVIFWFANFFLGLTSSWQCQFEASLDFHRKCLSLAETIRRPGLVAATKGGISSHTYCVQGRLKEAHEVASEAIKVSQKSNDLMSIGIANSAYGIVCYYQGKLDKGMPYFLKGFEYCRKVSLNPWRAYASMYLGLTFFENGEFEKSRQILLEVITILKNASIVSSWTNLASIALARTDFFLQQGDITIDELTHRYKKNRLKVCEGWISRLIGELLLNMNTENYSEIHRWIKKSIDSDERNGMRWHLAKDYALYSEYSIRSGDQQKARQYLDKALGIFSECGADGWVERYEQKLVAMK